IPFILPPEEEQIQIANFLVQKTEQIDEAIALKEQQIEKIKEYKTTLINSVVTGKIKISPEMVKR
ncbi:restriction endonuclease subunit S, partial [Enterobacter cloacae complex sp.6700005]